VANSTSARQSWLDDSTGSPLIDEYTQQLSTFVSAMADGRIDERELTEQEARLTALMKEIEPTLSDAQHSRVTRLLCELTAYNIMQTLNSLQAARPRSQFRG
jgi:hypothetical protein